MSILLVVLKTSGLAELAKDSCSRNAVEELLTKISVLMLQETFPSSSTWAIKQAF